MSKEINSTEYPPEQYPFRIKGWDKFQRYRFRNPPWIKLHVKTLQSEDWVMLDDASKLLAIVLLLIASQYEGFLPKVVTNPDYLKRVAFLSRKPKIKPLIDCGFLIEMHTDAHRCTQARTNALQSTETEYREDKKDEPPASVPPSSQEKELFQRGRAVLGKQAGGLIKKLLAAKGGDVALARAAIEVASTKGNPAEYIGGILRNGRQADGVAAAIAGEFRV